MGNCVSLLKRKKEPNKPITLAIIGLDDAGKTTICSVLSGEQPDPDIAPTIGFRNSKFSRCNFDVTLFDVGGGKNIRPIWKNYYGEVFAIIYVIDSSSPARLSEARDVFRESLEHPQLSGKPVLLLANKVDKDNHMTESDITHGLRLEETVNFNNCPSKLVLVSALQGTGNKMDQGISDGLDWLMEKIQTLMPTLEPRVEEDMRREKEARDKEREERRARVKKQREEREKAEQLERAKLGIEKRPDSDEDDIVDGDPFKALDINELKKKEQRLKAEKKLKQQRLKELGYEDGVRRSTELDSEGYHGRRGLKNHLSDDDGPTGLRMDEIETKGSAMAMFGRNNRASMLPPLEPLGSAALEGSEKKRQKKKKRLTDYHLQDSPDNTERSNVRDKLDLAIPRNLGRDPDAHDLTPRNAKPRSPKGLIQAGRPGRDQDEYNRDAGLFQRNTGTSHHIHLVGGIDDDSDDGVRKSVGRSSYDSLKTKAAHGDYDSRMSRDIYGAKKKAGLEKYPRESHGDALMYRNSLTKISPPNLRPFEEEDEGIEQDDSDNNKRNSNNISDDDDDAAELERFRASRRAHKLGSARVRREALGMQDRQKEEHEDRYYNASRGTKGNNKSYSGRKNRDDSDDDAEEEYGTYNPLKDTLRFSYDDTRDLTQEMEKLRRRQDNSGYKGMNGHSGQENKGYHASPTKARSRLRGGGEDYEEEDDYNNSRGNRAINSRSVHSPDEYEDYRDKPTDQRKKKKRNLLRSNKLAPSENDEAQRFGSPRMVQEHGSCNASDAETPTKNRNSRITQFHRNDSDFNTKWGLAEELPAIDDSFRRRRVPNVDDSDEGDVIF
ncbi:hypothetical protein EGW08_004542 [Elysia chlorotica]|uniref:ADP-ribosylation factor-like protein 13B n=1 Tax=Elysia chlorotica TaxID=188477 RepID=A0A433U1J7_ELYCH|nr:hypothetical protein EGW08_004542 [Elysia chlorotica]